MGIDTDLMRKEDTYGDTYKQVTKKKKEKKSILKGNICWIELHKQKVGQKQIY